jgi:hypothetical protein
MRTVILVYSRGGRSLATAQQLSARCGAEIRQILCPRYEGGFGWLRAWSDLVTGHQPDITVTPDIGPADLLILGGPIWAGRLAPPLRRVLEQADRMPPVVGVFVSRKRGSTSVMLDAELKTLSQSGISPEVSLPLLSLLRVDLKADLARKAMDRFCTTLAPLLTRRALPHLTLAFRAA